MKNNKTNVMRVLEQHKISYESYSYGDGETPASGTAVAEILGKDPLNVFKTLVTVGKSGQNYVFVVPVPFELDLKKAAAAVGEKSVAMIHVSEINALTGYVRGGCSPIGMKKQFETFYHESCAEQETIVVSAGRIGAQVELALAELLRLTRGKTADLTVD